MNITLIRRISQILFFVTIIYSGFLVATIFQINVIQPPHGTETEKNLLDFPTPVRTCRYIEPKPTLFESCHIRYLLNRPIYWSPWFLIALPILIILALCFMFGRFMCGWMCPLGFVSDILDFIRRKLRLNRLEFSPKVSYYFTVWRYSWLLFLIFLSIALVVPYFYGVYMNKNFADVACQVCPARLVLPVFAGKLPIMPTFLTVFTAIFSTISFIFLAIFLCGIFITRPWCRICPNGGFNSLFNKGALIVATKDAKKCTKCGICQRVCPFSNTHVYEEKKDVSVNHSNCIMCFNCVEKCPEKDCLKVKFCGKKVFSSDWKPKGFK
jgi:ferredoxin-type protein NapH